jgi:hypothetical protein
MNVFAGLIVLGLCLSAGVASAQNVYKWTDAQGTTHYTDQPPPKGSQVSLVKLRGGAEASQPAASPAPPPASGDATAAAPSPLAAAEAATRARNCERAKENLTTLASGAMLVDSTDPTTAKRLQPYQVEDAKRAAQGEVSTYCGAGAK